MARVTPERLSASATEAAQVVLKKFNEKLQISLPNDLLSCRFAGAEDEEAPINSQARGLFEWRIHGMGSVRVSALCRAVVHDKAVKPTKNLKRTLGVFQISHGVMAELAPKNMRIKTDSAFSMLSVIPNDRPKTS